MIAFSTQSQLKSSSLHLASLANDDDDEDDVLSVVVGGMIITEFFIVSKMFTIPVFCAFQIFNNGCIINFVYFR